MHGTVGHLKTTTDLVQWANQNHNQFVRILSDLKLLSKEFQVIELRINLSFSERKERKKRDRDSEPKSHNDLI